jgi:hypothetical protein
MPTSCRGRTGSPVAADVFGAGPRRGTTVKLNLILTTMILGTALALPGPSSAQGPPPAQDSVVGEATILSQFRGLEVDAHSDPDGSNPTGSAGAGSRSTYSVSGHVTCMTVAGRSATVGFAVDSGFSVFGNLGHLIFVEDNGSPGAGHDLANDFETLVPPTSCPAPTAEDLVPFPFIPIRPQPIQAGDITVVDAPARPTSKDQCKNGGWRDFPQFKNQGQCVAFVERGA